MDIWSLAVIVMKFIYGLPHYKQPRHASQRGNLQFWGHAWCELLLREVGDWDSDPLIDFLAKNMLRWDAQERLSAAECLSEGTDIGLFNGAFPQAGCSTPRLQPDQDAEHTDTEDVPTIEGPLWQNISVSLRAEIRTLRSHRISSPFNP